MSKIFSIIPLILLFVSCQNPSPEEDKTDEVLKNELVYPSITQEEMVHLYENCDFIDYILYGYDFSISQGEKPAIQASFNHISRTPANINPTCKPIGRVFYQIEGENVLEADIYFADGCQYYIFLKDSKPVAANQLSPAGVAFYQNIFKRFEQYKNQG